MKKLLLLFVVVGIVSAACDDGSPPPPPPPPPPTTTIPPPPPPPEPGPEPKDYYHLNRAGTYDAEWYNCGTHTGMVFEICQKLCPWKCWRDPQYVSQYCPWGCADGIDPLFDLTAAEMFAFGETGLELHEAALRWMTKLPEENRRCDPASPIYDPRFLNDDGKCTRSNVRKTAYPDGSLPAFKKWEAAHAEHSAQASTFRHVAQNDPIREIYAYDTIKGWCQRRNKHGGPR
jgi:hypothetical protein